MAFEDFIQDQRTVDAVVRRFTIIGEASNHDEPVKSFSGPAGPHIRKELCSGAKFCYFITRRIGK
jgi:hypothetical protein